MKIWDVYANRIARETLLLNSDGKISYIIVCRSLILVDVSHTVRIGRACICIPIHSTCLNSLSSVCEKSNNWHTLVSSKFK